MKMLSYVILIVMLLSLGAPLVGAQEAADPWGDPVATGIEYREYQLPDPVNVFVTRMERSNLNVTLESSIGQGRLSGGGETVSGMAQRYDGAINFWDQTWGNTNQVAVAINGFYFGPPFEPAGVPWSGQVHSGWYAKHFTELESGSGFAWNLDRSAFIGECVEHPTSKQQVYFYRESSEFGNLGFDGINVSRDTNEFILYTPQFGVDTGTTGSANSIEVLVQLKRPSLIIPYGEMAVAEKGGEIIKIRNNKGSTSLPFDHVALSMHGTKKTEFLNKGVQVGDQIGITHKIKDCPSVPSNDWDYTYASIGGAFYFLKNGLVQDFSGDPQANVRDPRTAIVFNDDYIYFIVVDGRDKLNSIGMTIPQLANFAKNELGGTHGIAQDGGGSSTMVVNGEVKNNTFCNIVICDDRIYLPIITNSSSSFQSAQSTPIQNSFDLPLSSTSEPVEQLSGDGIPLTEEFYTYSPDATGDILQRLVANGMMMVVVEPKDLSPIFNEGEVIKTNSQVEVRLGPGTNYGLIETVDANTTGIIFGKDNGLNGIWAKGYYWWHVLLEIGERDVIGWVKEPTITKVVY
jgi:hypothetical protein